MIGNKGTLILSTTLSPFLYDKVKKKPSPMKMQHDTPAPDGRVVPGNAGKLDELYPVSYLFHKFILLRE